MEQTISGENLNDFGWKNKLEDVNNLAAEGLTDKNAAWEKLHNRLRQKPRLVKPLWYRVAAACLLLTILAAPIIINKARYNLVKHNKLPVQPKNMVVLKTSSFKQDEVAKRPSIVEKKKPVKNAGQVIPRESPVTTFLKTQDIISDKINEQNKQTEPAIALIPALDSSAENKFAEAPVRKKLKVIHLNELGDPIEEMVTIVRFDKRHSFQIKLINHEAYTNSPLPSGTEGFNFFKPRNIPSN